MRKNTLVGLGLLVSLWMASPAAAGWRGSDKNWRITPILWTVDMTGTTTLGYRYLGLDFEDGFGPTRIAMDVNLQSPLIGLEIAF